MLAINDVEDELEFVLIFTLYVKILSEFDNIKSHTYMSMLVNCLLGLVFSDGHMIWSMHGPMPPWSNSKWSKSQWSNAT